MFFMVSKMAELLFMKFLRNLQISPPVDPVKFGSTVCPALKDTKVNLDTR